MDPGAHRGGRGTTGYHAAMLRTDVDAVISEVLRDRRLLDHRFYRRWEAGTLAPGELAAYASQYRYFEAALPDVLAQVEGQLEDARARALVRANLDDERAEPAPHLEMFDRFADAAGADTATPPTDATTALVGLYTGTARTAPVAALAALAAYEVQAPEIAATKAHGLRLRYGFDADGTRFWDVHSGVDELHGRWMVEAVARLTDDHAALESAATAAASAWWAFLDEREAAAPAASAGSR